jgi:hypothetical protein
MTTIGCTKCHKKFTTNYNLKRHQNTCNFGSKSKKQIRFKCKYCKGYFTRKDSLSAHIKKQRCKEYKKEKLIINGNKNRQTNDKRKIEINGNENINQQISIRLGNNSSQTSNIIKNSPINVVNLIVFGKDGIQNITSNELFEMLSSNNNCYESLISMVNFNPNKPQHHNVYYNDLKSSYGVVYENNKWVTKKIDEIVNLLLDAKTEDLNDIIGEYGDFLNKKSRQKIKETIENADYSKPDCRKKLISYLKPILFNNKDMIIKTRKKNEMIQKIDNGIDDDNDDFVNIDELPKVKKTKKSPNKKT